VRSGNILIRSIGMPKSDPDQLGVTRDVETTAFSDPTEPTIRGP